MFDLGTSVPQGAATCLHRSIIDFPGQSLGDTARSGSIGRFRQRPSDLRLRSTPRHRSHRRHRQMPALRILRLDRGREGGPFGVKPPFPRDGALGPAREARCGVLPLIGDNQADHWLKPPDRALGLRDRCRSLRPDPREGAAGAGSRSRGREGAVHLVDPSARLAQGPVRRGFAVLAPSRGHFHRWLPGSLGCCAPGPECDRPVGPPPISRQNRTTWLTVVYCAVQGMFWSARGEV